MKNSEVYKRKCETRNCNNQVEHIHHKDRNHKNNAPENLRYLCASCHRREHVDDNPEAEESEIFRPRDAVDHYLPQREGSRITTGFNMLRDDE